MAEANAGKKLDIILTIKEGFTVGVTSMIPIFVNILLWVLTIWIPYINVGTTIGLWAGIVSKASRRESIPITEIFNPVYRRRMGEYFLTSGMVGIGVGAGLVFFIIPGIVISTAWSLAILLVIDKGKNPSEALTLSNDYTYGNKGRIFCVYILVFLASAIVGFVLGLIPVVGKFLAFAVFIVTMFAIIGFKASIYRQLSERG